MLPRSQHLTTILRLSLCGVCLIAAFTAYTFDRQPEQIARIESWLFRKLTDPRQVRFDAALAEPDGKKAVRMMEQWTEDEAQCLRQDHLADKMQSAYQWLSHAAESRDDLPQATYWMERWLEFEDHSIFPQARYAELLCRHPQLRKQGIELLQGMVLRYPYHPEPTINLVNALLLENRPADAWQVVRDNYTAIRSNLCIVLWDIGDGFDYESRRSTILAVIENGTLRIGFSIAEACTGIELRLPPFLTALLSEPSITWATEASSAPLNLCDPKLQSRTGVQLELNEIEPNMGRLRCDGGSTPVIRLKLPAKSIPGTAFEFRAQLQQLPTRALMSPLRKDEFAELVTVLTNRGETENVALLRRFRALATAEDNFELFWRKEGSEFGADRSARTPVALWPENDKVRFVAEFTPQAEAADVRFDLPGGLGIAFTIETVTTTVSGVRTEVQKQSLSILSTHDLTFSDDQFLVTGNDPFIIARLPDQVALDQVRIEGTVQ